MEPPTLYSDIENPFIDDEVVWIAFVKMECELNASKLHIFWEKVDTY